MTAFCMAVSTCCFVVITVYLIRSARADEDRNRAQEASSRASEACNRYWLERQREKDRREAERAEKGFE
jgi:hypothetical protein